MTLEAYARARKEFRTKVLAHKKNRTVHVGDHVEWGVEGYEVSDVAQRRGQVEVVDTAGSVHIYSSVAFVSVR